MTDWTRRRSDQPDQPRVSRHESSALEVQRPKVVSEIDMQPLASGVASLYGANGQHPGCNPLMLTVLSHHGVQDECVQRPVPGDIHKSDELFSSSGAHPAKTVPVDLRPPVIVVETVMKCRGM